MCLILIDNLFLNPSQLGRRSNAKQTDRRNIRVLGFGTVTNTLEKAVKKAIRNGWIPPWDGLSVTFEGEVIIEADRDLSWDQATVLFDHGFAKALWGEEEWQYADDAEDIPDAKLTEGWQYHLKQMVIADSPITYLKANI